MAKPGETRSHAKGEVSGAFLLGLLNSFQNLNVLPASESFRHLGTLEPAGWYPYATFMDLLHAIRAEVPRAGAILFRAGIHFMRLWYDHGPGKTMIHSGREWLYANQDSAGYNSVVRGGTKDEIGWCVMQEIDEDAGIAVYENVTPLSPEYVRGVFYGGCLLFNDMDYIEVSVDAEDYPANPEFIRTLVTVHFRYQPHRSSLDLDQAVGEAHMENLPDLSREDVQRLLWRYESMKVRHDLDSQYFDELNSLLVHANKMSQELAARLNAKVEELDKALHQVKSMEGLLPICAWCKRMREDDSSWVTLEEYVSARTTASFTHTICPTCAKSFK
jgi:hypothetical protein